MKILVTTPTGKIGRRIVPELLAPEFSVRVIARDPAQVPWNIADEVEVVGGSIDDAATLVRALEDVEALFWCVPRESVQETDVRAHYERFARAASRAIRKAGTPRVVSISAVGKGLARKAGPISGLHAMEDILNESGAAIRHIRCSLFMENLLLQSRSICRRGLISYPMPGDIAFPMTAVTDIADTSLKWLARRDWKGIGAVAVHGPEDVSFNRVAQTMEQMLEQPVRYKEVSANYYVRKLVEFGTSVEYARGLVDMFSELAQGISRAEPRTAESTTPTTLHAWLQSELLPLLQLLQNRSQPAPVSLK